MNAPNQLAIIAGNGIYPVLLANAARKAGVGRIFAVAFTSETNPALAGKVDEIVWLRVGQLQRMLTTLRDWKVGSAIMAGQIAPRNLFDLRPDWRALLLLARLGERNAESLFGAISEEMEKVGVRLLPATTFLEDLIAAKGLIAGPNLSRRNEADIEFGWPIARQIAALDIGQTIVVKNGTILAVEGFEGTNDTIRRGGRLGRGGAIVLKVAKPKQDMRFDVPVIGPETLKIAHEAKIRALVVEAGRTLLLQRDELAEQAAVLKLTIVGR